MLSNLHPTSITRSVGPHHELLPVSLMRRCLANIGSASVNGHCAPCCSYVRRVSAVVRVAVAMSYFDMMVCRPCSTELRLHNRGSCCLRTLHRGLLWVAVGRQAVGRDRCRSGCCRFGLVYRHSGVHMVCTTFRASSCSWPNYVSTFGAHRQFGADCGQRRRAARARPHVFVVVAQHGCASVAHRDTHVCM